MFSEYYFYLTAFIDDEDMRKDFDVLNDSFPTIYRIDRIKDLKISEERFHIPYASRFEEGEFRKRIQFMYGGKLRKIKFKYSGTCVEAVLDRMPTAKILKEEDGVFPADILKIDSRFTSLIKWLGENHINIRLSGKNTEEGYAVYKIREIAFGGGTKLSAEDGFLQFMIDRLFASSTPAEANKDEDEEEDGDDMKLTSIQSITAAIGKAICATLCFVNIPSAIETASFKMLCAVGKRLHKIV